MGLHADTRGAGPRIVLVHGFTQNRRCWGEIVPDLCRDHTVLAVDAPGHGRSGHADADLWEAARLVGEVGGAATYLGYSMGGRICLHLALRQPELVERLVLVGTTAGIRDAGERAARAASDDALAGALTSTAGDRDAFRAFLERWLAGPLFATLPPSASHLDERLENDPTALAASLRACSTGRQEPLWDRLGEVTAPTLVVAGALDHRFVALGRELEAALPDGHLSVIENAGHAAHLEQPHAFLAAVRSFLGSDLRSGRGGAPEST